MPDFAPLPAVEGGWPCVVADPPWSFRDKGSRIAPDQRRKRLLAWLRLVESRDADDGMICLVCRGARGYRHTSDCALAHALGVDTLPGQVEPPAEEPQR